VKQVKPKPFKLPKSQRGIYVRSETGTLFFLPQPIAKKTKVRNVKRYEDYVASKNGTAIIKKPKKPIRPLGAWSDLDCRFVMEYLDETSVDTQDWRNWSVIYWNHCTG
jgi:hypothetical protein